MAALSNLTKMLEDSKTRTFVILIGVVVVGGIAVAFMRMGNKDDALSGKASKILAPPSSIKGTVGNVTPEKYTKLLREENTRRVENAEQSNKSAIPTIINDPNSNALNNAGRNGMGADGKNIFGDISRGGFEGSGGLFGNEGSNGPRPKTDQELRDERLKEQRDRLERERLEREAQQEAERLRRLAEQEQKSYQEGINQRAKAMQSHAQAIFTNWGTVTKQNYTAGGLSKVYDAQAKRLLDEYEGATSATKKPGTIVVSNNTVQGSNRFTQASATIKRQVIKAGTVIFGVLDTGVNSDAPGPILATIVGGGACGKFKGGRLIGSIEIPKNGEKIILNFKTLNLPKYPNSFKVSVVAIDADTARTALASDVDHHYLLRYGSLFASSFMEGVGKAISQPPGTQTNPSQQTGGTAVTVNQQGITNSYPPFTDLEKYALVPLGTVGEEWGKAVKPYFNTPPSITVDQGTSIGLLFLSDLDLTEEQ